MAEERVQRRLAAILAADMVGYSRLIGADEEGTIARQKAHRAELIDPVIATHGGRIVKTMGDGLLVEFPSVVDAVKCAIAVQQAMSEREADVPEDRRIQYRIGINLGDIVIDGDDILGDGVNIAARLEGEADPGGICVSGDSYRQVLGKIDQTFEDLGERVLKNIADPVRAYRVMPDRELAAQPLPLPEKLSIAVLPFDNMSGDPEQEYFADGIAEDIITALSRFHWFFVIARNSSFVYKGKAVDVKQIAHELGVQYVLEGSVRKGGNRVRITAQLIDALTGAHVWAERFDRELNDIFAVQDEITEAISGAVAPSFILAEVRRAERKTPESLDAWDYTMRGYWHMWRWGKANITEARRLFEVACKLDPTSAAAYSGLAHTWVHEIYYQWTKDLDEARASAFEAAQRAVALDGNDAWAQTVLGMVYIFMRRLDDAFIACRQALDLNPSLAFAEGSLAICYAFQGEYDEAVAHADRAERLSPRDPHRTIWYQARAHAALGIEQYEESVTWAKKSIEARPDFGGGWRILAACYGHLGRFEEATAALQEVRRLYPDLTIQSMRASHPSTRPEHVERYLEGLRKAGLPESDEVADEPPLPDKPSIAVLPFDNMSNDPEQEFFGDGLAEDIITALSKIKRMRVIARNSTFAYKGRALDLRRIAEELGVRYMLEGSVRRGGNRLRITAQLIDATDGSHLWAERYDRTVEDLFDIQDEITKEIVTSLRVQLTDGETARVWARGTNNVEAWQIAVRAFEIFTRFDASSYLEARVLAEKATKLDPDYAFAWAILGLTYWFDGRLGFTGDTDSKFARAAELAEHAMALDASDSWCVGLSALVAAAQGRHDEGVAIARRGIELYPGNADVRGYLGLVLMHAGNYREAVVHSQAAMSLNPIYPNWYRATLARALTFLDEFDEALTVLGEILETEKAHFLSLLFRAYIYGRSDREPAARIEIAEVRKIAPNLCVSHLPSLMMTADTAALKRFSAVVREAGLPE
jgi:adenylate cyclase